MRHYAGTIRGACPVPLCEYHSGEGSYSGVAMREHLRAHAVTLGKVQRWQVHSGDKDRWLAWVSVAAAKEATEVEAK